MVFQKYSSNPLTNSNSSGQGRGGGGGAGGLPPIKLPNLTGGGDNLAGHCFVLGDLTPINVLK